MTVDVQQGHRLWAATYDSDPNPLLSLEFRTTAPLLGDLRSRRFVDVACGTGRWLREARRRGAEAVGIDRCPEMLLHSGRQLVQGEMTCLPLRHNWADLAMCAFAMSYVDLDAAMRELARVTRPGGWVIVTDVHPEGIRRGWKRSFRSGDRVYELEHRVHSEEDWLSAGRRAGLALEHWRQPYFAEPERAIFRRAGREALFDAARGFPAVLIAVWRRAR